MNVLHRKPIASNGFQMPNKVYLYLCDVVYALVSVVCMYVCMRGDFFNCMWSVTSAHGNSLR